MSNELSFKFNKKMVLILIILEVTLWAEKIDWNHKHPNES